jgi:predicted lipoprotein with Yx(FWY)xxD motif
MRLPLSLLIAVALTVVACGADDDPAAVPPPAAGPTATATAAATAEPTAPTDRPARRRGIRVKAVGSAFGRIVADGRGQAFYLFDKEQSGRSECYGACAKAWPPVLAGGRPLAGKGIDPALLGTARRRSGRRQVTYAGQPMYYYVADAPGRVLCPDVVEFGGTWLVLRPDGSAAP